MTSPLHVTVDAGVQVLTLNRPDKLNALNEAMLAALGEALVRAQADDAACVRGMALLAEPVDAEAAERYGLIWRGVDDEALAASASNALEAQLALQAALQREAGTTEDFREGVRAFRDRRAAVFAGR